MKTTNIVAFCKKHPLMAVVVDFKAVEDDWRYFRIERVEGQKIAFTGMTDDDGTKHDGNFFWVGASEIQSIRLRD